MFLVEYVAVVTLAEDKWGYTRWAWLDVAVILLSFPMLSPVLAMTRLARLVRLARVLRILHLVDLAAVLTRAGRAVEAAFGSHGLAYLVGITTAFVVSFGAIFAVVEPGVGTFAE